jgi:uncharacterized protein with von Willebrand factor type A (vWA) domain
MRIAIVLMALTLAASGAFAQDAAETPDVNKVIEDLAAIGPEALLARVKELKSSEQDLKGQADALRLTYSSSHSRRLASTRRSQSRCSSICIRPSNTCGSCTAS